MLAQDQQDENPPLRYARRFWPFLALVSKKKKEREKCGQHAFSTLVQFFTTKKEGPQVEGQANP